MAAVRIPKMDLDIDDEAQNAKIIEWNPRWEHCIPIIRAMRDLLQSPLPEADDDAGIEYAKVQEFEQAIAIWYAYRDREKELPDSSLKKSQTLANTQIAKARGARLQALANLHADGQLVLWKESERGLPNVLSRCALFSSKNRNEERLSYQATSPLRLNVIGGGEVIYFGEDLRQDDEKVWMQLIHLAKEARSEYVTFTPHAFLKSIKWTTNSKGYDRLLNSIRRLKGGTIEVYNSELDKGRPTSLLADYEYSKGVDQPWTVKVFDKHKELLFLFDRLYSRLNWEMRLALPEGVATWLHTFYSSHRDPFPHKLETLAIGAGLALVKPEDGALVGAARTAKYKFRLREAKKLIKQALEDLKSIGFIRTYEISPTGLVFVVRTPPAR